MSPALVPPTKALIGWYVYIPGKAANHTKAAPELFKLRKGHLYFGKMLYSDGNELLKVSLVDKRNSCPEGGALYNPPAPPADQSDNQNNQYK